FTPLSSMRKRSAPRPGSMDRSFFFSSRRRHTRFSRDWSSDVCSSDLAALVHRGDYMPIYAQLGVDIVLTPRAVASDHILRFVRRSEERRVGKSVTGRGRPSIRKNGYEQLGETITTQRRCGRPAEVEWE